MKRDGTNDPDMVDLMGSYRSIQPLDALMALGDKQMIRLESLKLAYEMFKGSTPPGKDRRNMPPFDRYELGDFMDEANKIAEYINSGYIGDDTRKKR